jgi:hypothetical protein
MHTVITERTRSHTRVLKNVLKTYLLMSIVKACHSFFNLLEDGVNFILQLASGSHRTKRKLTRTQLHKLTPTVEMKSISAMCRCITLVGCVRRFSRSFTAVKKLTGCRGEGTRITSNVKGSTNWICTFYSLQSRFRRPLITG